MTKRVGILGLLVAAAVAMFHPATASAQDRYDYRQGYAQRDYRDHDRGDRDRRDWDRRDYRDDGWRAREWREARERHEWREHRDRRYDYGYQTPGVYGYFGYGR